MDLIGSRGCGCTCTSNASKGVVDEREGSRRLVLSHAVVAAEVTAPFDRVDIAQWLKTFPTTSTTVCAGDHKAAGYTVDDDGTPMSINVEMIGTGLVIQQYRFEIADPSTAGWCRCRISSPRLGGRPRK